MVCTMMRVPTTSAGLPTTVAASPATTAEERCTGSPSCTTRAVATRSVDHHAATPPAAACQAEARMELPPCQLGSLQTRRHSHPCIDNSEI